MNFKTAPYADTTRLSWPEGGNVVIVDSDIVTFLLRQSYGRQLTDAEVEEYNDAVEAYLADPENVPPPAEVPPVQTVETPPDGQPEGDTPPPVATSVAAGSKTPDQLAAEILASMDDSSKTKKG